MHSAISSCSLWLLHSAKAGQGLTRLAPRLKNMSIVCPTIDMHAKNRLCMNSINDMHSIVLRGFSSMSLRRPPQRRDAIDSTSSNEQKLRTHAVSLYIGDYTDNSEEETDLEAARLREQQELVDQELRLSKQAQEIQREDDALRRKWIENAKPPVRVPIIDESGRAYGRGGRKTASARVWIRPGLGHVVVNRKDFVDYFDRLSDRELILSPFAATRTCGLFDVTAYVQGGGLTGQAGAIRHGLARALNHYNPDLYRPPLKRQGMLTRDPRKVERKKIGHKKARKKPQWVKR